MVTDSIVSFVVRKGNPKHISTWADLVKPGRDGDHPEPLQLGSAKWNLMAAYGAQLALGKKPGRPQAYLAQLLSARRGPAVER